MNYPPAIQKIINQLSEIPTVGPKTAERYVLFLIKQPAAWLHSLADSLNGLPANIVHCSLCHALSAASPCPICSDPRRRRDLLCVVSETKDMLAIEDSRSYNGLYHILGGTISAINSRGPEHLFISSLMSKLQNDKTIAEVILALNPDFEGETTSLYLKKLLTGLPLNISRLARGLPSGAALDYADQLTIAHALKFRNKYN